MNSKPRKSPPAPGKLPRCWRFVFYWLPLAFYCTAIFFQSAFPFVQPGPSFPHFDKLLHMAAYGIMAWLFARALAMETPSLSPRAVKWAAVAFACLYGLSDEVHQAFVPSRTADVWDLAADALGALIWSLAVGRSRGRRLPGAR